MSDIWSTLLGTKKSEDKQLELDLDETTATIPSVMLSSSLNTTFPPTASLTSSGVYNSIYSMNANAATNWNNTITATSSPYIVTNNTLYGSSINPTLRVAGDAEFEGDIKIKGVNLTTRLDKIEERLGILHPNEKLEDQWAELKELGERYRELEKEIIEKEAMWNILKK